MVSSIFPRKEAYRPGAKSSSGVSVCVCVCVCVLRLSVDTIGVYDYAIFFIALPDRGRAFFLRTKRLEGIESTSIPANVAIWSGCSSRPPPGTAISEIRYATILNEDTRMLLGVPMTGMAMQALPL